MHKKLLNFGLLPGQFLLHDNVRPHTANRTQLKILELDLETINHSPYLQGTLNVVPHILFSINFCMRTIVFFIIEENRIFRRYEINRFFTINSLFFVQICPEQSEILSTVSKNPRASNFYVQHNKILNLLIIFIITVVADRILMFQLQRKKSMRGSLELRELSARKLFSRLSGSF